MKVAALWQLLISFCLVALVGCGVLPVEQFQAYRASFDDVRAATDEFIDAFEPYERANRRIDAANQPPFINPYEPTEAAQRRTRGQPVLSPLVQAGMDAVSDYNEVLAHYARGESYELIQPRVNGLAVQASTVATLLGAADLAGAVTPAAGLVTTVLEAVSSATDAAQFQQAVTDNRGKISEFLMELRNDTPLMWSIANTAINSKQSEALRAGREDYDAKAEKAAFQGLLDAWVVALEQIDESVKMLEAATDEGAGTISVPRLIALTQDLRMRADDVRLAARVLRNAL